MKKILASVAVLGLLAAFVAPIYAIKPQQAHGPWEAKVQGDGALSGGSLPSYGVNHANLGWNFKANSDNLYNGQLNVVEKDEGGEMLNHYKLYGYQVDTKTYNCDTHEMRVEGFNDEGYRVAAHFRGYRNTSYPNSVWYWVKDGSTYLTNTGARLTLDKPFFVLCNEEKVLMESLDVYANDTNGIDSSTLYDGLNYRFEVSGTAFAGDTIDFDAQYSITNRISGDIWTDSVSGYESYGTGLLDLFVNGNDVQWGAYNDAHEYSMNFMGDGSSVNFMINDTYYPNNTGFLTVDIYAVPQ